MKEFYNKFYREEFYVLSDLLPDELIKGQPLFLNTFDYRNRCVNFNAILSQKKQFNSEFPIDGIISFLKGNNFESFKDQILTAFKGKGHDYIRKLTEFASGHQLTDQQKAEHKKINLKYQRLNIPLRSDLKLANLDLKEAMENLDQKKIDDAVKKINDINAKLFKNKIDQKVEFIKILTDEQKKMLKDRPCGMQKMRKVQMMKDCGDMGLQDTDIDVSFGFGADLPMDIETDDSELEAEPED